MNADQTISSNKSSNAQKTSPKTAIGILSMLYFVGIIGITIPLHEHFILLTPINLLLSLSLVLYFHPQWNLKDIWVFGFCFLAGLSIEMIGVQTGLIFGEYQYGATLGWKIAGTPLMIGINWLMLVYCSGATVNRLIPRANFLLKAALAAGVMTLLDVLIEPVAMQYDFWSWPENIVPLQNYIAWFVIAFVLLSVFHKITGQITNKVATALLILQFLFFGILNLFLP